MTDPRTDAIASFYDEHPYPPPLADLDRLAVRDERAVQVARVEHHRIWPSRDPASVGRVLVAGCGTSQAARHALRSPGAEVVGIDVSETSIEHTRRLIERHAIENLTVERRPIEEVASLGGAFDHVVCTGVLHHLADPDEGLRSLASVIAPGGAVTLMVYAPFGRVGVTLIQEYCRLLGVEPTPDEIGELVGVLRELPTGHPLGRLLRETRDFQDDDALADALLNPRDRTYRVDELFELLDRAGLRFGRWSRQAPYLPDCGAMSETPHRDRLAALTPVERYSAMELFRGTIDRHTVIVGPADEPPRGVADVEPSAVPLVDPAALAVDDTARLPPGAAAALLNRSHTTPDIVLFVDAQELTWFRSIDGERSVGEHGIDPAFVDRLCRHDLVVLDTTAGPTADSSPS